ncbi:MAG: arsenate reductase ArsC [Acidobacteriota bacterium]
MPPRPTVLFLCTGNSARSQIAEALLRHLAGDRFEVLSAGVAPAPQVHPLAVAVLEEAGIATAGLCPKTIEQVADRAGTPFVITVCDHAARTCPTFPGAREREHWPLEDPAAADGSDAERLEVFRRTRDELERRIRDWLARHA